MRARLMRMPVPLTSSSASVDWTAGQGLLCRSPAIAACLKETRHDDCARSALLAEGLVNSRLQCSKQW